MPDNDAFASWIRLRAIAAGYNVDAARGGRTQLAEAAGMSVTQIGRTLEGKTTPSVESQRGLARALKVPFSEMLVRSGFATREDFTEADVRSSALNLIEVAEQLGVPSAHQEHFSEMIRTMARLAATGDEGMVITARAGMPDAVTDAANYFEVNDPEDRRIFTEIAQRSWDEHQAMERHVQEQIAAQKAAESPEA
jgi:transcriptional regulator with XRE-family HTH domain